MPHRPLPLLLLASLLIASSAGAEVDAPPPDEPRPPGAFQSFLKKHGVHLLVALAVDRGAQIYHRSVGHSGTPLLFKDPASIEWNFQEAVSGASGAGDYLGRNGLETLRYATPVVLIAMSLRDRREMAADLLGVLEGHLVVRGATNFFKDAIGRERPYFEEVSPARQPRRFEELDADEDPHRSFPSGHASGSFFWASYLERAIAREIGLSGPARALSFTGLYGAAGWIGWTRIRSNKHYPTDIIAGAALGIAVSRTAYRINHPSEYAARSARRPARLPVSVRLLPPTPLPGGLAITLSIASRGSP